MNRILSQVNLSPIRCQIRKRLDKHSDSSCRRITSKITRAVTVIQSMFWSTVILLGLHVNVWILGKMAGALAPGQRKELLRICQLDTGIQNARLFDETVEKEMIRNLKQIYHAYVEQKVPFMEQVQLLSLLPRSWNYEKMMEIFGCSQHAIKAAHRMHETQEYIMKRYSEPSIRQRVDPERTKHFVNLLVKSSSLLSDNYQKHGWYQ